MKLLKKYKRQKARQNDKVVKRSVKREIVNEVITCKETCTNLIVMYLTVLRQMCGFGEKRLKQFISKTRFIATCIKEGYIDTRDIIMTLYEEARFKMTELYNSEKRYVNRTDLSIDIWTDKVTAIVMLALYDVFDFGKKRLLRVYQACVALNKEVIEGNIHVNDMFDELRKINIVCR